ncbi:hypothetical protein [Nonomuraea typhae]|uniref:hypothetical protein n=1 Tax=Nonomuraea typhae TaxID=2603600 RepID=UPI0015E22B0A|nr:hypothetical protein [Nonomuraea typhae]
MNEFQEIARVRDGELRGQASGAGARALLAAITAEEPVKEPRRRPWKRLAAGALVTAALATAAVVGPSILNPPGSATSYANSALDIRFENNRWVARIKDPFADPERYEEGFRAVGLDVKLQFAPSSPKKVGKIFSMGGSAEGTGESTEVGMEFEPAGCEIDTPGCTLILTLGTTVTETVIKAGRPAKAGEQYANIALSDDPQGSMPGYQVKGKRVGEVEDEIRRRGLKLVYQIIDPSPEGGHFVDPSRQNEKVGRDWYAWESHDAARGEVRLLVTDQPVAPDKPAADNVKDPGSGAG